MKAAPQPLVEQLPWDSEFFGRAIGRARSGRLDSSSAAQLVGEATEAGLECVYFVAGSDDVTTVLAAEERGFHLVDVRLVLERPAALPLAAHGDGADFSVEPARAEDLPQLEPIAEQVARLSRYACDPHFSAAETARLYRVWIANALRGYADVVLVARERAAGEVLGFLCCKMHGELCDLQLAGVTEEQRQRKIGRALFEAGIRWGQGQGATRLQIVTQGRNVAAQRLFQQLGFLTSEVKLCYHLWLPRRPR